MRQGQAQEQTAEKTPQAEQVVKAGKVAMGTKLTHTFEVESTIYEGMKGSITVKMPSAMDLIQMGIAHARLRTDSTTGQTAPDVIISGQAQDMAAMISTLVVVVTHAPHWWYREETVGGVKRLISAPEAIEDTDLIKEIFWGYANWRTSFRAA